MLKKTVVGLFCTVALFAQTEPFHTELDIYTNKSFLKKSFKLKQSSKITTKVPSSINLLDVQYNIGKNCTIDGAILSQKKKLQDEISKNIDKLKKKKQNLNIELQALFAKEKLLKSLSLKDQTSPAKIDKISSYMMQNLIINSKEIVRLKEKIKQIDQMLKDINGIDRKYKDLEVAYTCKKSKKTLEISYPQNNIKYSGFYDINADTKAKTLTIDKRAKIDYKGIENFNNIDINIYSYVYNQNVKPQKFYPRYLGQNTPKMYKQAKAIMRSEAVMLDSNGANAITHQEMETKSFYNIRNTKLIYGDKNVFHVDTEVLNTNFKTIIDAYGTSKAYLQASIKTKKNYPKGFVKLYLNHNPIASIFMPRIKKEADTKLYFGEDEQIQIKKELIKTEDEKTFFGSKNISTLKWEYKIINKKSKNAEISFINRVPVSKDAGIDVKIITVPDATSVTAKGKMTWDFILKAKETKNIVFGYEISKRVNKDSK